MQVLVVLQILCIEHLSCSVVLLLTFPGVTGVLQCRRLCHLCESLLDYGPGLLTQSTYDIPLDTRTRQRMSFHRESLQTPNRRLDSPNCGVPARGAHYDSSSWTGLPPQRRLEEPIDATRCESAACSAPASSGKQIMNSAC